MLLLTSALMVLVAADTCSDCTAVVNAVQVRILFHYGEGDDDDHCTMCILGSMFTFQLNKLRHILKGLGSEC